MTPRWPEPGLARHSRGWQGQVGGGVFRHVVPGCPWWAGGQQAAGGWPWPPALLWEGRAVPLLCTMQGPELGPRRGKDMGGGKGGFSSLGRGREPVRTARRGWRRREGKHRLCKKRNWSYRRSVLSRLSSGPRVTLEGPWEGAHHIPCQRLSPLSRHAHVPWEAFSAAQIPKEPN